MGAIAEATNSLKQATPGGLMSPNSGTTTSTSGSSSTGNYPVQTAAPAPTATPAVQPTQATTATQPQQPAQPSATETAQAAVQNFKPATSVEAPAPISGGATVEGRLDNLLNGDSAYMKAARDSALQQMNKRGLMQSSIAVGAAQDAAIRNALPIAQQDAQNQFSQDNTYNLHRYDVARVGVDTQAQGLLSAQNAAQGKEKSDQDFRMEQQKAYITLASAANDRYAQEFSEIQRSDMTAAQKVVATEELKKWKLANDNWLNQTMAVFSGSSVDPGPFTGGNSGSGSQPSPNPGTGGGSGTGASGPYTSLASAASLPADQQLAALRSAGVSQKALDHAVKAGWPLFKDGKYLSGWTPPQTITIGQRTLTQPAKPKYTVLPT